MVPPAGSLIFVLPFTRLRHTCTRQLYDMHSTPRRTLATKSQTKSGHLLHACVILALFAYGAGSTGPVIVHTVHLLHHLFVLHGHLHVEETDHAEEHTHGDLIDHAVIWSNAGGDEEGSTHTIQQSRFSLHIPLVPFSSRTSFRDLSCNTLRNDRIGGQLRAEPPTPPPRFGPPQQFSI